MYHYFKCKRFPHQEPIYDSKNRKLSKDTGCCWKIASERDKLDFYLQK